MMDPLESIDNLGGTCSKSNYSIEVFEENDCNSLELDEQDVESDISNFKDGQNHVCILIA